MTAIDRQPVEKWDPKRETYDAFCDRRLRELVRPMIEAILDEPEFAARLAAPEYPDAPRRAEHPRREAA